ncbi:MAG: dipeptide ABC transporter ATP-binding protein [Betaproteobacteria bacterium]
MVVPPSPVHPVLDARGLQKHYPLRKGWLRAPQTVRALDGVDFTLRAGRTLAVVGESGCGKTTLARLLTLIEQPTAGTLVVDGRDITGMDPQTHALLRQRVQIVFQNPFSSLNPRKTLAAILDEPLIINTGQSVAERRERVDTLMRQVGLRKEQADRFPHMFSGGQRQRIAIARAMALNPAVVIADEPVSALDVSIQAQILNLFMDLQQAFGTAYVFISHNLSVVEHVAHEVLVMYLGKVVEFGTRQSVFSTPLHPYTQALLSASPTLDPATRRKVIPIQGELPSPLAPPSGCAFHPRCPQVVPRCRAETPQLRDVGGQRVACHRV